MCAEGNDPVQGGKLMKAGTGGKFLEWCRWAHESIECKTPDRSWTLLRAEFQGHRKECRLPRGSSMDRHNGEYIEIIF